jgi:hypothetical protein
LPPPDLRPHWRGAVECINHRFHVTALPKGALAAFMLALVANLAQGHTAEVIRLLPHARARTDPHMGNLNRGRGMTDCAGVTAHKVAMALRTPPGIALFTLG